MTFRKGVFLPPGVASEMEYRGEQEERRRVIRLIDNRLRNLRTLGQRYSDPRSGVNAEAAAEQARAFEELRHAVQHGHQR